MKNNRGQSLLEALFVVVFTTIIMFAFLQVCIMAVDDMTINEAAFVGMRSAAVTKSKFRTKEADERIKKYLIHFYPFTSFAASELNPTHFVFAKKKDVEKFFKSSGAKEDENIVEGNSDDNNSITIWEGEKHTRDFSGRVLAKQTLKVYYFTRVMFGRLVAPDTSKKDLLFSGSRRYQSARNRMIPSPDEDYYYKAYPGAEKFKDDDLQDIFSGD